MRLASFVHDGVATWGAERGGGLVDLGARLGARYPSVKTLLAAGDAGLAAAGEALASVEASVGGGAARTTPASPSTRSRCSLRCPTPLGSCARA